MFFRCVVPRKCVAPGRTTTPRIRLNGSSLARFFFMSLAAEAEKRRYFWPEILTHSNITAVQDGIERKYDMNEARMLHPLEKR